MDSGKKAIDFLIKHFSDEKEKPCVTTPVDYIVQMIDENYGKLSSRFIFQNINNKEREYCVKSTWKTEQKLLLMVRYQKKFDLVSYTVLKNIRQWPESY